MYGSDAVRARRCVEGRLWELDGRKTAPVEHGPCSPDSLLESCVPVCQGYMDRAAGDVNFAITALGPVGEDA